MVAAVISEYTAALGRARERIDELEEQLADRDRIISEYSDALTKARSRIDELTGVREVEIPALYSPESLEVQ